MNSSGVKSSGVKSPGVRRTAGWILLTVLVFGSILLANHLRPPVIRKADLNALGYTTLQAVEPVDQVPALETHRGEVFDAAFFHDRWTLVFFGFTACPDVCPTTLAVLSQLTEQMNEMAPQVLFVSVDPARDSPDRLKHYVEGFHPTFIGVTGNPEQVAQLARRFHVVHEQREQTIAYSIDHSTHISVVNPAGEFTGTFAVPHIPERMVRALRMLM